MNCFGNYFKDFLDKKGYKLEYAADEIGVSFGLLGHYINGRRSPSYKFLDKFFKAFNISEPEQKRIMELVEFDKMPEELKKVRLNNKKDNIIEQLKDPIKMMSVPVYSSVAAGLGFIPDAEPIEHILIPELSGDCIGARVSGDSMEPTFYNGDIVIFKKDIEVGLGEIGIFQNKNTGEALVKRLKKKNGVYVLESDNHIFPDIEIKSNEIVCCGKVVNVVKKDLKKRSNPLIEKIESLDPKQQEIIEMMINGLLEKK